MQEKKRIDFAERMDEIDLHKIISMIQSQCKRIVDIKGNEEDLRIAIEKILRDNVWDKLKIPTPRYEFVVEGGVSGQHWGEIDALYGLVIFEYKKPDELSKASVRDKAVDKMIETYIPGLLSDRNIKQHVSMITSKGHSPIINGIIWDGNEVIFIDYQVDMQNLIKDPIVGSYKLDTSVLVRIIRSVIAAFKKKINARLISADFGYDSDIVDSKFAVKKLYNKLLTPCEKTQKLFEEWEKLTSQALSLSGDELRKIAIEYGFTPTEARKVDGIKLFFAIQTYYTLVIKLLSAEVASRFYDHSIKSFMEDINRALSSGTIKSRIERLESGDIYNSYGIQNFLEGELFSWFIDEWDTEIEEIIVAICEKFLEYDVESMIRDPSSTRDVFKLLYEGLVPKKEVRHKLGMYTTPDWLAELIIDEITKGNRDLSKSKFLDPGAGTGTFLTLVIRKIFEKCKGKIENKDLLYKISKNVVGFDIDSLAVLTARANYLIALASTGLLAYKGKDPLEIPIYLANSMITAEELSETILIDGNPIPVVVINAGGKKFYLPLSLLDKSLELLNEFKRFIEAKSPYNNDSLQKILKKYDLSNIENKLVEETYDSLLDFRTRGVDSVWIPILKTYLMTNYFKDFDYVVGNPPWLAYRFISNSEYQNEIKKMIKTKYNLVTDERLLTHMEMATLFIIRCIDIYLKNKGQIGFVMPKSIMYSDQHNKFRKQEAKISYRFIKFLDTQVDPLFSVPTCGVILKKERGTSYPLSTTVLKGKLPTESHKIIEWNEAAKNLEISKTKLFLGILGNRTFLTETPIKIIASKGYYHDKFFQGATIIPQTCWFVDIVDENIPIIRTSKRANIRAKIKENISELPIEEEYLFNVLTSAETLPFCILDYNLCVLPIEPQNYKFRIITKEEGQSRGKTKLVTWLNKVISIWGKQKSSQKLSIYDRINYHKLLISQNPSKKYKVVYLRSGTHLASCVIENKPTSILIESTLYSYETNNVDEAFYLAAIFNSKILDDLIKPFQSKGFGGAARDIHKKPLEYPFPKFNKDNPLHQKISELGKSTTKKAKKLLPSVMSKHGYDKRYKTRGTLVPMEIGSLRTWIRNELYEEIARIDEQVKILLQTLSSIDLTEYM